MNANEFIEKTKLTFSCLTDNGVFSKRDMERAVEILIGLQAENERLKLVIVDVHDLSYPGLARNESTLLNKIYKLTMGYSTDQALKGGEK